MSSSSRNLGALCVVLPLLALAGCNSMPNSAPGVGPNIQFKVAAVGAVWPKLTQPYYYGSPASGLVGYTTPQDTNVLTATGQYGQNNPQQPVFIWDPTNPTPTYSLNVGIVPGDTAGITTFSVSVVYYPPCSNTALGSPYQKEIVKPTSGAAGPNPGFIINLTYDLVKTVGCGYGTIDQTKTGSGSYRFEVSASNGKFLTDDYFYILIGEAPNILPTQ